MSSSIYRGKVYTNEAIKGPFAEAKDDFSEAYDILKSEALGSSVKVSVHELSLGSRIILNIGGVWLCVQRDGIVEIGEGGA